MKINEERSTVLQNYKKLYNIFTEVNNNFDLILKKSHFTGPMIKAQETRGSPLVGWMNSNKIQRDQLLVPPEEASSVNITKITESAEFIGRLIPKANILIGHLERQRKISPQVFSSGLLLEFKTKAEKSKQMASKIQEQVPKATTEEEKREALLDYYRSLADASVSSRLYSDITAQVSKQKKATNLFNKIWFKIKDAWEIIRRRVGEIGERIKGLTASAILAVVDSLGKIKDSLKYGRDEIVKAFITLSDKFHNFIIVLIDQMFQFLTRFSDVARKRGYSVSSVDVTIPSVRFEFVPIFLVSIPIPVIDPPDITVSITKDQHAQ